MKLHRILAEVAWINKEGLGIGMGYSLCKRVYGANFKVPPYF